MPCTRSACLLALCLAPGLAGCGHAMCEPRPAGAPWRAYEPLLPTDVVVCGPNRISPRKPSHSPDDYPQTQLFVFYRDKTPADAFARTIDRFVAAGWRVVDSHVFGTGSHTVHDATVAHPRAAQIKIGVNRNDWGIQGSFTLKPQSE